MHELGEVADGEVDEPVGEVLEEGDGEVVDETWHASFLATEEGFESLLDQFLRRDGDTDSDS